MTTQSPVQPRSALTFNGVHIASMRRRAALLVEAGEYPQAAALEREADRLTLAIERAEREAS